jgi:hypothetical protein
VNSEHIIKKQKVKTQEIEKLEKVLRARMKIVNDLTLARLLRNLTVMAKCVFGFLFVC